MRTAVTLLALLLGCAHNARQPDDCDTPYANTLPHCVPRKPADHSNDVKFCNQWGECEWVDRSEVHRRLRELGVGR